MQYFALKATATSFRKLCCAVFLLTTSVLVTQVWAQKITDPSQFDVSYESKKAAAVGHTMAVQYDRPISNTEKGKPASSRDLCESGIIPLDVNYTEIGRNDDGSFGPIVLPFAFNFCGASYTSVWINTNGNLTFTGPLGVYTPDGFPIGTPMVAPFWADVDTRSCGGAIHYKLESDHMIVTWDAVGFYQVNCSLVNTFQVIISDGNASILGAGQNVQFRYGDMQWTTGDASGGSGGFGGAAATVGYNSGDGVNYEQVGRFDHAGNDFDGPFDGNDGISYLDNTCFIFDAGNDADGDGFQSCYDCDDNDPDVNPDATELCNGYDDNCDGVIDEGFDTDGDGYTSCGGDCDDSNADINPSAEEICDGIDNNCDGAVDEGFTNTDGDDQADCVDADDDNDGCLDEDDANPLEASGDADCDGVSDDCDICPSGDDSVDNNGDGIADCSQLLNYEAYSEAWYCADNKIAICHNGNTICVSKSALPAHYNHGDNIGPCTSCDNEERNIANLAIAPVAHNEGLEIYPNPATENLAIHFDVLSTDATLVVVDQLNRVIMNVSLTAGQLETSINVAGHQFSNGMYFVVMNADGKTMIKRFVINK
jgi:hypothetical protein